MTAMAQTQIAARPCARCRELVYVLGRPGGGTVTVDAEREPGGIFGLDEYDRAVRRSLVVMSEEVRGLRKTGGYVTHECLRDLTWMD